MIWTKFINKLKINDSSRCLPAIWLLCNGLIIVLLYRAYQVTPHRSQRMFWQQHRSSVLSSFPSWSVCKVFEVEHEIWLIEIVFPRLLQILRMHWNGLPDCLSVLPKSKPFYKLFPKNCISLSRRCWKHGLIGFV